MASKSKSSSRKKKNNRKKRSGGGRPPPRKRDDGAALRGMLIGAGVFVFIAILLLVPVGGKTAFNHVLGALGLDGDDAAEVDVSADTAGKAAPQENLSEAEQGGLDNLIDKKKKK